MGEITLKGYQCERCGHKWAPRENVVVRPKVCPKCKSAYWDSPRKLAGKKQEIDFKEKRRLR
jgi:predicted Zn-ribbon and HTH transcriptional regulator